MRHPRPGVEGADKSTRFHLPFRAPVGTVATAPFGADRHLGSAMRDRPERPQPSMASRLRQRSRRRSILLVLPIALAVSFTPAVLAQETNQMTLPQVTVTAPFVPLYLRPGNSLKAFQRNPYYGNNRVEEDRFAPVPCGGFRIDPASAGTSDRTCLQGFRLVPAYMHVSKGGDRSSKHCDIDHDVTIYTVGDLSVEADVLVFDPYKLRADGGFPDPDCYVAGYNGYDQEDFQDMNRITRGGTDWHDLRGETCAWSDLRAACETKSIEFSYESHKCIGIRRPGPRWRGGFVWMLTASICRTDSEGIQPGDVARALDTVQIRRYDPVGNIAAPTK
jgi:hypothetical protein